MSCQEVAFAHGNCRIEIDPQPAGAGLPAFVARMWTVDDQLGVRPIVLEDGGVAEIHGETEALALSSALTYLEARFGGLSEYAHPCVSP